MAVKRHNKQHDARASSFRRMAKALRKHARGVREYSAIFDSLFAVAGAMDDEAKILRSMR